MRQTSTHPVHDARHHGGRLRIFLLLVSLPVAACGGRPSALDGPLVVSAPVVVGRHLAYLDQTREAVILVRPYTREIRRINVGQRPSFMVTTPDGAGLLVVCKGWKARVRGEVDEAPTVHLINPATPEAPRVFPLVSPFDEVALSVDGRHAVAFFSAGIQPGPDEVFRNPNAVAILDLDETSMGTAPLEKTVRSFGGVPIGVLFSGPSMAPVYPNGTLGTPRTLAVVLAKGYVTFLDMSHPERSEITVRLTRPEDTHLVVPEQLVFAPEAGTVFLRASGTSDIYAFTLTARDTAEEGLNDFVVSINTLAAGSVPADLGVYVDGGERKVLIANQGSRNVTIIDAYTSQFRNIEVGDPVDRVLLYPAQDPEVAVVFSQGSPRARIHFLDLKDLEVRGGQNLATLHTEQVVRNVIQVPGRAQAIVLHNDSRSVLSLLELTRRTLSPVTAHGPLGDFTFNSGGDLLVGFTFGLGMLGVVNLDNLGTRALSLGYSPSRVLALAAGPGEEPDEETGTVVVDHGSPGGHLTVVPNPGLADTADTFVLSGFFLEGLLNQDWDR